jgi:hypothetical protein
MGPDTLFATDAQPCVGSYLQALSDIAFCVVRCFSQDHRTACILNGGASFVWAMVTFTVNRSLLQSRKTEERDKALAWLARARRRTKSIQWQHQGFPVAESTHQDVLPRVRFYDYYAASGDKKHYLSDCKRPDEDDDHLKLRSGACLVSDLRMACLTERSPSEWL